ncbi:hypothetical protein PWT90_05966 [Aphanocladium album]|nr:hypothetical protein PWT90_05966 [Aphanocladium album]
MARVTGHRTKHLNRDERARIRTLYHDGGFGPSRIAETTSFTIHQVKRAIRATSPTPSPRKGRPLAMTDDQVDELVAYVMTSRRTRQMTYLDLSLQLFNNQFSPSIIKRMLYRQGFRRRVARRKPPISEKNRVRRLAFAQEHKDWSIDQWSQILWTDETWVAGGTHRQVLVTRRAGEEYDPTCVVDRLQRKRGWMFWGSFSGAQKGPGLFWEKAWGSINSQSYLSHTVPVIGDWLRHQEGRGKKLVLMQDGASAHRSKEVLRDLEARGIEPIDWPAFSPDLNPIETCWNWMKDYIELHWGWDTNPTYIRLRTYVNEAWEALPEDFLAQQLASMPARMEAVIAANGLHTKY